MKLIVGLGNPGAKYAKNRHNIGFMALDQIAADHGFPAWKGKHQGSLSEGRFGSTRAVLLKPETFMNNSGQSVQAAMRFYKLEPEDVIVLHDEIDLAPGKVKFKQGGGHAGHNGLRSIHAHIGPDYARVRLGVGHPGHKDAVPGYVLRDFAKAVQTVKRLDLLCVLTVCDIRGVGSDVWNNWKAMLIRNLYAQTAEALETVLEEINRNLPFMLNIGLFFLGGLLALLASMGEVKRRPRPV